MAVLTLNAGSSSLKFALFDGEQALLRGAFESITDAPKASAKDADGKALDPPQVQGVGHEAVLPALFTWIEAHRGGTTIEAAGHRIVHGGDTFLAPVRVDDAVIAGMDALSPLAPLHQPHNVNAVRAVAKARPDLPQVACFDTAFHRTMPVVARRWALPERLGLRRYGFHGLSYEWIASQLPPSLVQARVVVAHLGSGASLCAMQAGRSVETTMGTTPLDGLVMGTRCGTLDAGVVLYLLQQKGMSTAEVETLLYHDSGLLGVSGLSADMRALHASNAPAAEAAIELFVYRVAQEAAMMATAMGGLDGLVFTAGIGEHDSAIRAGVCARLAWLGVAADGAGKVEVHVIPTDEEAVIARQTAAVLGAG